MPPDNDAPPTSSPLDDNVAPATSPLDDDVALATSPLDDDVALASSPLDDDVALASSPLARRFRFGVICSGTTTPDASAFSETVRKAEALGYSTFFVPDHFVDHPLAPPVALAHAAAITTTLRIGPLVLGNDYKHPVVLAREAATLDLLSGGRLELGLGAGWMTVDYEKSGLPLDRPGTRIARLEESIQVLRGLFAPGEFSFAGDHYTVTGLDGHPKPVQQPVPLIIGGGGPKILGVAARYAQIVGINANLKAGEPTSPESIASLTASATDQKLEWLRAAAGPRFDDLEIQTLCGFVAVTPDATAIHEGMAGHFGVSVDDVAMAPVALVGTVEEIIERLHARRERWQMSYVVVGADAIDAFAPVVAALTGQ
jgi:probable F420-dependent oxidoreductase